MNTGKNVSIGVINEITDRQTIGLRKFPINEAQIRVDEKNRVAIAETFFIVQTDPPPQPRPRKTSARPSHLGDSLGDSL